MKFRFLVACAFALALGACGPRQAPAKCVVSGLSRVGGPISLVDERGAAVTEASFAGKPALLYFGFASCPDICPAALQTLARALDARGAKAPPIATALVSIDPQRDTPEKLAAYVRADVFPPGLKGLTGTPEQIEAAKTAFKAYAGRRDMPESAMGYVMDHSSLFYLMDGAWKTRAIFPSSMAPADMQACIEAGLT